jgi:lysozyme
MNLIDQLRRDEDDVLTAYPDHLGYLTIGMGILIDPRKPGAGITPAESIYLTQNRIEDRRRRLEAALPWFAHLDPVRQAGLLNMAYQLGSNGLLKFVKALAAIRDQRWALAETELLDSEWARQTPQRARRVARQIATGEWQ